MKKSGEDGGVYRIWEGEMGKYEWWGIGGIFGSLRSCV